MKKIVIYYIICLFFVNCAEAQLQKEQAKAQGNLRIENNRLFVTTLINGCDSLEFLFDTGCVPGVILPDSIAKKYMNIDTLSNRAYFENQKKQMVNSENTVFDEFEILLDSITVNLPIGLVDNKNGMIMGIGSRESHRYWSINYEKMNVSILPNNTKIDKTNAMIWDFEMKTSQILVKLPMTISYDGRQLTTHYKWLLDTGAPYAFIVTNPDEIINSFVRKIPSVQIYDHVTEFLANKRLITKFYLDSITFGGEQITLNKRTVALIDEGWRNMMVQYGCIGAIGMDILKHYNTVIDFKENRVILQPHGKIFDYYSTLIDSGLGFHLQSSGMVSQIEVGHSAQAAGLQLDDIIVQVNGTEFDRNELRKVKDGTPLTLAVKRNNKMIEIKYTARKTLKGN